MGQYYKALLIGKHGKRYILESWDYDNGSKLMEHSYINNSFMRAAASMLVDYPMKVAWIGDYSDDKYGDPYEQKMPHDKFMRHYKACWNNGSKPHYMPDAAEVAYVGLEENWYLINHTQKLVIDLGKYYEQNKWEETWTDYQTHEKRSSWYCVHPLSLLTACGNDRGGGDYHSKYPDYSEVGTWAFDKLEYRHDKPEGYTEVMYSFKEED